MIFSRFTMSEFVEQRSATKFCLRSKILVLETFRMLQKACGDLDMSQKNVYKWYTIGISKGSLNKVSKDSLGRQLVVFASR